MNASPEEDTDDDSMVRKGWLPTGPTHLGRALASVKAGAARWQGQPKTRSRAKLPQMVAPEQEWELLRVVEQAARRYRRAQRALAHREAAGGAGAGEAARAGASDISSSTAVINGTRNARMPLPPGT